MQKNPHFIRVSANWHPFHRSGRQAIIEEFAERCRTGVGQFPPEKIAMTPQRRRLEVEDIGDITVVNFLDKKILDDQNIQVIGEQLLKLVEELGRQKILLNFSNVEFLSSAALGKLIVLNRKLNETGGKLVLCNIDRNIYEVFEITKLNKVFAIAKDEQSGLQSF